jgi:hypothetical protein
MSTRRYHITALHPLYGIRDAGEYEADSVPNAINKAKPPFYGKLPLHERRGKWHFQAQVVQEENEHELR